MTEEATVATGPAARTLTGKVVSDRMDKTTVVLIERKVPHPKYGKYVKRSTRLFAHDPDNQSQLGDQVLIRSHRPISKRKHWVLVRILGRDGSQQAVEA